MFGEDIKSIEPEEKYEESIAERVKTRRQNTQRTFAPSSPPKKDYSEETANFLKYMEEEKKVQKRLSDDYDSNGWPRGSDLKLLTNKQMLNRLPILLAQIQAGNNSNKLKNEARQILYSCITLVSITLIKMETFFMNTKIVKQANQINLNMI